MSYQPEPCRCEAYSFPHRPSSGHCDYLEGEYDRIEPTIHHPSLDERLDDPRRGQATWINAGRAA